jgi:hypothetical protein
VTHIWTANTEVYLQKQTQSLTSGSFQIFISKKQTKSKTFSKWNQTKGFVL